MAGNVEHGGVRGSSLWRIVRWSGASLLLLLPLLAMQVTDEVDWTFGDFAVFGALLLGVGLTYELAVTMTNNVVYRAGVAVALGTAFFLVWANLTVGVIGTEDDPANAMYGGVLAVGIIGAAIARFQPGGMAAALLATAVAHALVAVIALIGGMGSPASGPAEIVGVNSFFVLLWLLAAELFRRAAGQGSRGRGTHLTAQDH